MTDTNITAPCSGCSRVVHLRLRTIEFVFFLDQYNNALMLHPLRRALRHERIQRQGPTGYDAPITALMKRDGTNERSFCLLLLCICILPSMARWAAAWRSCEACNGR